MTSMSGVVQFTLVKYQPIKWFLRKFDVESHNTLSAFKCCKYMSGNRVVAAASTCKCGGSTQFPFLESNYNKQSVHVFVIPFQLCGVNA